MTAPGRPAAPPAAGDLVLVVDDSAVVRQALTQILTSVGMQVEVAADPIFAIEKIRRRRPDVERPYRAFGYPVVPALYVLVAVAILLALAAYKTQTTWPGLLLVLAGVPVYFAWTARRRAPGAPDPSA